ncbi:MAG: hypothetical protein AB1391_00345 [Candidatus Micrarchaeota archaeon]
MILNRAITLIALVGGTLALILSIILGAHIPIIIAAALFAFSLFIWKYGYLLMPHITSAANIVEVRGEYTIPPTRDYVLKKSQNGYYATKFLEIMLYESTVDKDDGEKHSLFALFEKALCSLKHVVKITFLFSSVDVSKYIDEIKTKRSEAEAKRSHLSQHGPDVIRLDREIAMLNRLLERLTFGERPMEIIAYASTTALGATKDEAISRVKRQAQEIKTILSSTLSSEIRELSDLDMIKCFEWDYFIPGDREELLDETF